MVSIFGNTGDGKSFTMNECFFNGKEVFHTSSEQDSCTIGIWVAYDRNLNVICIDTEGMLGSTNNENQRMRLLLKVFKYLFSSLFHIIVLFRIINCIFCKDFSYF